MDKETEEKPPARVKSTRGRLFVKLLGLLLCLAATYLGMVLLHPILRADVLRLFLIPVLLAGALFGLRLGFALLLGIFALDYLFLWCYLPGLLHASKASFVSAFLLNLAAVTLVGWVSDLYRKNLQLSEKLRELSLRDSLTLLYNRRYVDELVAPLFENFRRMRQSKLAEKRASRSALEASYGLYMIDVDHFKKINDLLGHKAGDQALVRLAQLFRESIRIEDVVARWGGEEFLIILKDPQPEYLRAFAEKLRKKVEAAAILPPEAGAARLTISVGSAAYPFYPNEPGLLSFEHCQSVADQALLKAKANGRNRSVNALPGPTAVDYLVLQDYFFEKTAGALVANEHLSFVVPG